MPRKYENSVDPNRFKIQRKVGEIQGPSSGFLVRISLRCRF